MLRSLVLMTVAVIAGCGGGPSGPGPSSSPKPTPTPIAAPVQTPAEAAALVIAADPRFRGAIERSSDIIGASKWWTATPLAGGAYRIELVVGWGDCPAGCINRHTWTYDVSPEGEVELVGEIGDPVPEPLPE